MPPSFRTSLRHLRSVETRIKPDAGWMRSTRETLLMQAKNSIPSQSTGLATHARELFRSFERAGLVRMIQRPVAALATMLTLVVGGSMYTVSASESALPGDVFYGLKLATEQARMALTSTTEDKIVLKSEFTGRRVKELQKMAKENATPEQIVEVTEGLKRDLSTLRDQLTQAKQDSSEASLTGSAKLVDAQSNQIMLALQETKSQLSQASIERVTEAQTVAAETGVKAIEVLAQQHQDSADFSKAENVAQAIEAHTKTLAEVASSTFSIAMTSGTHATASTEQAVRSLTTTSTEITSSTVEEIVKQVKDATSQTFTLLRIQDQLQVAASVLTQATATTTSNVSTSATLPIEEAHSTSPSVTTTTLPGS